MQRASPKQVIIALVLASSMGVGCTFPVYHHAFITKYDANMNVVGYEEIESITQRDPYQRPLSVKIDSKVEPLGSMGA